MRILYILHQFYPEFSGGTERVTYNLARAAQRAGHYAHILACSVYSHKHNNPPATDLLETSHHGLPVTLIPREQLGCSADIDFSIVPETVEHLTSWLTQQQFDLCHLMHTMRMGSAVAAVHQSNLPYLITLTDFFPACYRVNLVRVDHQQCSDCRQGEECVHHCLVPPWSDATLRNRYQQAHRLLAGAGYRICPSPYVQRCYQQMFAELQFRTISHGVAANPAPATPLSPPASDTLRLGLIGTINPQKGVDHLLRAFNTVKNPQLRLIIAGNYGTDLSYNKKVKRLINSDSRVEYLGPIPPDDVFPLLQSLDLLCLPSQVAETFSLIVHEACAARVPVLVTDLGAPADLIRQYNCGRALPAAEVTAWSTALNELTPELLQQWQQRLPLPQRIEEEAFFYQSLYQQLSQTQTTS